MTGFLMGVAFTILVLTLIGSFATLSMYVKPNYGDIITGVFVAMGIASCLVGLFMTWLAK
jgi:hypothetical protein